MAPDFFEDKKLRSDELGLSTKEELSAESFTVQMAHIGYYEKRQSGKYFFISNAISLHRIVFKLTNQCGMISRLKIRGYLYFPSIRMLC